MMQINKVAIELYGQGFAPMVCIYCLMLWLIQQPVPLPQHPCWSPQGHLKTDAWLITRVTESHSWYDGSVAKHKPFKHLLLCFCHLFLVWTLSSTVSFHVWPMANRPASSSQTQMIGCKDQDPGALVWAARDQESSLRWTSCAWGLEETENCLGLWEKLGAIWKRHRVWLDRPPENYKWGNFGMWSWVKDKFFEMGEKKWIWILKHMRITAHICTAQRN